MKRLIKKIIRGAGFEIKKINRHDIPLYIELYGEESVKNRRFYNISAGTFKGFGGGLHHPCWTNIDVDRSWKNDRHFPGAPEFNPEIDIAHDLLSMKPIPVKNSSAELVHSRFAVDRITDEAALFLFKEVYRMLKKGGIFRIVSTNLDLDYRAYKNNDRDYFFWFPDRVSIEQALLLHQVTQTSTFYPDPDSIKITDEQFRELIKKMNYEDAFTYLNSRCSVENHKKNRYDHFNWWNQKKYERMLGQAGFNKFYLSAAEQSASPVMRNEYYFDNEHNYVMMYMEAVKN